MRLRFHLFAATFGFGLALAGSASAQQPAANAAPKAASPPPASQPEGKLLWTNGQSLSGRLIDADSDSLRWKAGLFASPADLAFGDLYSITLPAPAATAPEPFALTLRDGSRLFGNIESLDANHIVLKSQRHGQVRVDRTAALTLNRLTGAGVIWNGPFGDLGWAYPSNTQEGRKWTAGPGGALVAHSLRQRITLPWKLDTPVEVAFEISSTTRPEFDLRLLRGSATEIISVWEDELVLRRGDRFLPLLTLGKDQKTLGLRVFWDYAKGSGAVTSPEGRVLARWETGDPAQPASEPGVDRLPAIDAKQEATRRASSSGGASYSLPPDGVTWLNRGKDLTIESLRLRAWNGALPSPKASTGSAVAAIAKAGTTTRFENSAGEIVEGTLSRFESDLFIVSVGDSDQAIFLDDLLTARFPVTADQKPAANAVSLSFSDGTSLLGNLDSLSTDSLTIRVPFSPEPIVSRIDGLREIRFPSTGKAPESIAKLDKIQSGATSLHGRWEPGAGKEVQWRLIGASAPVALDATTVRPIEITRAVPENRVWPKSPALFLLSDGQIAPGELVAIDREGESVTVRGDLIGIDHFDAGAIQAIQFGGPEVNPEGFKDPGWAYLSGKNGSGNLSGDKIPDTIDLEAGDAIGHPSILAGDELQFEFRANGFTTVRLHLFGDGANRETPSTRVLFAHYGNEVYCGLEESEGNFANNHQTPVPQNESVKIRVAWTGQNLQTFVNGSPAFRADFNKEKAPRTGRGLIFEPANLWGNGIRPVTISNFRTRISPGYTWVPPVAVKAREQALFLPRFRKNDPPRHLLVAHTGDLLRGSIEAATKDNIAFRAGLENVAIPRDRAAAAIWLKPPPAKEKEAAPDKEKEKPGGDGKGAAKPAAAAQTGAGKGTPVLPLPAAGGASPSTPPPPTQAAPEAKKTPLPDAFSLPAKPSHWFVLRSGARLGLVVESFGPDAVTGHSTTLGACRIPIEHIHSIRNNEPARDPASAALTGWQMVAAPEPTPEGALGGDSSPLVGKVAPKIELPLLDGGVFDLSKEQNNVIILDFWATWCGPCVRALPEMIDAFSQLDQNRVKFVAVNQAEAPETIKTFLTQRRWPEFAVALDGNQSVGRAYGVEGIPHTVIIGPDGRVAHVTTGFRPGAAAAAADLVKKLLAGEAIE